MNPTKHGFRPGRTCLSQLLEHRLRLEKSNSVDVICLDFTKDFDKVEHRIALNKVKKNELIVVDEYINNFLANGRQFFTVN